MKQLVKRAFFSIGQRSIAATFAANFFAHVVESLSYLRSRYTRWDWTYDGASIPLFGNRNTTYFSDHSLNFFARLILENKYSFAIEIGAHSADRITKLAALFPNTKMFGMDVTEQYKLEPRVECSATLVRYSAGTLKSIAASNSGRGLLCSTGTMAFYTPDQFHELIETCAGAGLDIALAEPNVVGEGSMTVSMIRNRQSWYHPYLQTLWKHGYATPDNGGQQTPDSIANYGDARTYIFAKFATK